jgi:hypothetical protein
MMVEHMLSTPDNPYNPFIDYDEWDVWDKAHGYNSASLLARVIITSDELSEADQSLAIEQAIEQIVSDMNGIYIAVADPNAALQ